MRRILSLAFLLIPIACTTGPVIYSSKEFELNVAGNFEKVRGASVTSLYFVTPTFFFDRGQDKPLEGRLFTQKEYQSDAPVAILTNAGWRQRFQADPTVIGTTFLVDGKNHTIVGIMPPSFETVDAEFLLPAAKLSK